MSANSCSTLFFLAFVNNMLFFHVFLQIYIFSMQLATRKVEFSACGFFPIDFSLLYSVGLFVDLVLLPVCIHMEIHLERHITEGKFIKERGTNLNELMYSNNS